LQVERNYVKVQALRLTQLIVLSKHRAFFIVIAFAATLFLSDIWTYKEFVRAES